MKEFFKENAVRIICIVFLSVVVVIGCRVVVGKFTTTANLHNLENVGDRVRAAEHLGWTVDKTSETKSHIYIPNEMSEEFIEYNEMQKICGFDLCPYMGKGAMRYTYRITNFPHPTTVNAFLNLIIYDGKIIGGDCDVLEFDDLYLPVLFSKADAYIS